MLFKLPTLKLLLLLILVWFAEVQQLCSWASLVALMVKNLLAKQETRVRTLGWKDPLEKGMASHSSILAWRIPMETGAWHATVHGDARVGHD